jgi:alkylhydroperoxidase/carboxymuconolactone decarboxylase family protein YurZ
LRCGEHLPLAGPDGAFPGARRTLCESDRTHARARLRHPGASASEITEAIAVLQHSPDWKDIVLAREMSRTQPR